VKFFPSFLQGLGALLITLGVLLWNLPAGLVVLGVFVFVFGLAFERGER